METAQVTETGNSVMTTAQFFEHWQGHRKLTRKLIEAYPEGHLFTYSLGGMRPFSTLVLEMTDLAGGGIVGVATGKWPSMDDWDHVKDTSPKTKAGLLELWDKVTAQIDELGAQVPVSRFQENEVAFGMYEGTVLSTLLYFVDNEIHHRGQAYVYLRSLGITPPPFWERN